MLIKNDFVAENKKPVSTKLLDNRGIRSLIYRPEKKFRFTLQGVMD